MGMRVQPGVIGCAIRPVIASRDRSLEEIIYDTVQLALADAAITIGEVEGIVVAANDQFDGRSISVMMASGSVGGVDRDIMSTPSASEHAFILGALRVATGQFRTQLIVSWSPTEVSSMPEVQRLLRMRSPAGGGRPRAAARACARSVHYSGKHSRPGDGRRRLAAASGP